ncbi:ArsR/SmtB family transcription factor [Leptospira ryugenii]|uniref:ArsR/SmtB family transcription factor n=1 Tax=Leptospira ryugenii TaxID=1917863 RepID=UPI003F771FAF
MLAERQTCVCGEIVDLLPLSQSTVSQHLKDLKLGGLVQGEIEGKHSCYCINWEALHEFHESYLDFYQELQKFKKETNCC